MINRKEEEMLKDGKENYVEFKNNEKRRDKIFNEENSTARNRKKTSKDKEVIKNHGNNKGEKVVTYEARAEKFFNEMQAWAKQTKTLQSLLLVPQCDFESSLEREKLQGVFKTYLEVAQTNNANFKVFRFKNQFDLESSRRYREKVSPAYQQLKPEQVVEFEEWKKNNPAWDYAETIYKQKFLESRWADKHKKFLEEDAGPFCEKYVPNWKNLTEEEKKSFSAKVEEGIQEEVIFILSLHERIDPNSPDDLELNEYRSIHYHHAYFKAMNHITGPHASEILKELGYKPGSLKLVKYNVEPKVVYIKDPEPEQKASEQIEQSANKTERSDLKNSKQPEEHNAEVSTVSSQEQNPNVNFKSLTDQFFESHSNEKKSNSGTHSPTHNAGTHSPPPIDAGELMHQLVERTMNMAKEDPNSAGVFAASLVHTLNLLAQQQQQAVQNGDPAPAQQQPNKNKRSNSAPGNLGVEKAEPKPKTFNQPITKESVLFLTQNHPIFSKAKDPQTQDQTYSASVTNRTQMKVPV